MLKKEIDPSHWKWFGWAGHFWGSIDCHFHLCTQVGPYLVSTIGAYLPHQGATSPVEETIKYEDIGQGRKYETMVFVAGSPQRGGSVPFPRHFLALAMASYNTAEEAQKGHLAMCKKWSGIPLEKGRKQS